MAYQNAFTDPGQVVLDACRLAQDTGAANLTTPFYEAAVRDAIQELCFDTSWDHKAIEENIPASRRLTLPEGLISIRNIWLFNGDNCNITSSTPLWLKPNFSHKTSAGFFANQKGVNVDPLIGDTFFWDVPGDLYYGGIDMGVLFFSNQCVSAFNKVRIEYVGLGQKNVCTMPSVPTWARQAVTYWVAHRACEMRMSEDRGLFNALKQDYADQLNNPRKAWYQAMVRYKRMDQKQRRDADMYTTYMGYGPH